MDIHALGGRGDRRKEEGGSLARPVPPLRSEPLRECLSALEVGEVPATASVLTSCGLGSG